LNRIAGAEKIEIFPNIMIGKKENVQKMDDKNNLNYDTKGDESYM